MSNLAYQLVDAREKLLENRNSTIARLLKPSPSLQTWCIDYFYLIAGVLFFLAGAVCISQLSSTCLYSLSDPFYTDRMRLEAFKTFYFLKCTEICCHPIWSLCTRGEYTREEYKFCFSDPWQYFQPSNWGSQILCSSTQSFWDLLGCFPVSCSSLQMTHYLLIEELSTSE